MSIFIMKRHLILLIGLLLILASCSSTYPTSVNAPLLLDSAFPHSNLQPIETADEIFALNENMRDFIDKSMANLKPTASEKTIVTALVNAIFDHNSLSIAYSAGANTSASQTFEQGTANCLSLTIMTYAMTQHLGMRTVFQDIAIPEFWTRRNGNTLINKHINLAVKPRENNRYLMQQSSIVIDFDSQQGARIFASEELSKSQIVSLFYANKGAYYLISGDTNAAYAYFKAAIEQDVKNEGAWLNLGVLFSQHNYLPQAQAYYEMAASINPNFASAYENLALLYKRQGKDIESALLMKRLHNKRLKNPYYHMVLGDIAAEDSLYPLAIEHYKTAIFLNNKPHEFHFSLAQMYFKQGDIDNAKRYLQNAKQRAKSVELSEQYASKISILLANHK